MKNEWLFSYKTINGHDYRLYDNRIIDIKYTFLSEYKIFLENMIDLGMSIFFIETLPNHNFLLTKNDFEFFQKYALNSDFYNNFNKKVKGYEMPETVKTLRENQSSDLIDFYDDFIAESLFIISKLTDQLYHFNLVVCIKPESELKLQNYLKKNFKIIKINNIKNITKNDLTYKWMDSTFNFNELEKFKNTEIAENDYHRYNFNYRMINTPEKIEFENYIDYCMTNNIDLLNNPIHDFYQWEHEGKVSEMQDQRFIFQNECKTFGWIWFFLEYQFIDEQRFGSPTYPVSEAFTYIPHESEIRPFAIVDASGNQKEIKDYEFAGMFDVIENIYGWEFTFRYHFINVQWKKYGTLCKQRLRNNIKK